MLRVSSQSNPNSVAGAIASVLREREHADIQVVGAGALNQAVKAIAIARGFLAPSGIDLVCVPAFAEVEIEGEVRTAIRLSVQDRRATVRPDEASVDVGQPVSTREAQRIGPPEGGPTGHPIEEAR